MAPRRGLFTVKFSRFTRSHFPQTASYLTCHNFPFSCVNYMPQLATNSLVYFLSVPDRFDQVLVALHLI